MRLLVTGGLGFIGSNFIRYMLNKYDYEIINFDKVTYCADINNLREFENDNRYHLVIGDLCRKKDNKSLYYTKFENKCRWSWRWQNFKEKIWDDRRLGQLWSKDELHCESWLYNRYGWTTQRKVRNF